MYTLDVTNGTSTIGNGPKLEVIIDRKDVFDDLSDEKSLLSSCLHGNLQNASEGRLMGQSNSEKHVYVISSPSEFVGLDRTEGDVLFSSGFDLFQKGKYIKNTNIRIR